MGALATTVAEKQKFGKMNVHVGTFTQSATSGTVDTGLSRIVHASVSEGSTNANGPELTYSGGAISVTKITASGTGSFVAFGY